MVHILNVILIYMLFDIAIVSVGYYLASFYNLRVKEIRLWCWSEKTHIVKFKLKYPIYIGLYPIGTDVIYEDKPDELDDNFNTDNSDSKYVQDLNLKEKTIIALSNYFVFVAIIFMYYSFQVDLPRKGLGDALYYLVLVTLITAFSVRMYYKFKSTKISVFEAYSISVPLYLFALFCLLVVVDQNYIPFYNQLENLFFWKYSIRDFINEGTFVKSVEAAFFIRFMMALLSLLPTPFGAGKYVVMLIYKVLTGDTYKEKESYGLSALLYPILYYVFFLWLFLGLFF
jgi:hypothetical protein